MSRIRKAKRPNPLTLVEWLESWLGTDGHSIEFKARSNGIHIVALRNGSAVAMRVVEPKESLKIGLLVVLNKLYERGER